ncbi:GAF domain-containing sensor histidine kinase [Actinomadura bangladeshensis]|uniref:Oxygen sensor histidine kinase NreB n=2 Tax=Actinomadura bangladeshensis TaxID=453573 RepID=A0A6L9QRT5_9ACTN|nr:GAF domain-containing sensor histidine kinase [Actinomadura bangladeshensis]NEA25485.1 GAF domain-containing sensor histidine kinase [Actinomadura bangladeshensis]NEA28200.1 GAF domain-containing sensor histidine kinase [Actinomadura bangladeshensis]
METDDGCRDQGATLHAVSSAVLAVTRHLSVHEVLQVIVRAAAQLLDARYAALGVPDDEGSFAEFVVAGVSDEEWERIGPLPRQHGMLAAMLKGDVPKRLGDIRREPEFEGWPVAHPVLKDFLGVPIRDGEDVLGIIFLANKQSPGGFTQDDEDLLTLFAAHAALAMTNARLYEHNRELTVVAERNRMARELHDAVAQKLFSLRLTARTAAALAERDAARTVRELAQVERLAAEALAELRAVIFELRPADLADGLVASLRKHVEVLDRAHEATVRLAADDAVVLPEEHEAVAFRITQEALYNALRHAQAGTVEVRLATDDARAVLEVADDGSGFDASDTENQGGLGLASMRDRAYSIGGELTIDAAPGRGTTVRLEVPL